jgi:hypothetical protein
MDDIDVTVKRFFDEVGRAFSFLEKEYGYEKIGADIDNPEDFRDAAAEVNYQGKTVGVSVSWYKAGGVVGVSFVEQPNGHYPDVVHYLEVRGRKKPASMPMGISLYSLAEYLGVWDKEDFLLNDPGSSFANAMKNDDIIRANMRGVLEGLARAVKKIAPDIVKGDTSMFRTIFDYATEKLKKERGDNY